LWSVVVCILDWTDTLNEASKLKWTNSLLWMKSFSLLNMKRLVGSKNFSGWICGWNHGFGKEDGTPCNKQSKFQFKFSYANIVWSSSWQWINSWLLWKMDHSSVVKLNQFMIASENAPKTVSQENDRKMLSFGFPMCQVSSSISNHFVPCPLK